jgi:L-ascorbate metabolism protein UlaG (beta-lactamase superfamily)
LRLRVKHAGLLSAAIMAVAAVAFCPGNPSPGRGCCFAGPSEAEPVGTILAQVEEGDFDESFEAYGDDSDEIFEYDEALMAPLDSLVEGIRWLGHASFLIESGQVIYIDPYDIPQGLADALPMADLVLVTHDHADHFSPDAIKRIAGPSTIVISIESVIEDLPETIKHSRTVAPGDTVKAGDIMIEAVPAYNIGKTFHPKEKGYVGFIIHLDDRTIYHAGDTDLIPEMEYIKADIALLPIGGTYTMNAAEAAEAADVMKPEVAIPMHWGKIVGTLQDAREFQARCETRVLVLEEVARPVDE